MAKDISSNNKYLNMDDKEFAKYLNKHNYLKVSSLLNQRISLRLKSMKQDFNNFPNGIYVYSFRTYNSYTLFDLINNSITVCKPELMNDPFDCPIFSLLEYENNLKNDTKIKMLELFKQSFSHVRIRSFIANTKKYIKDNTIPQKVLMWSHYADSHRGFCVCYHLTHKFLESGVKKNIPSLLKKIEYTEQALRLGNIVDILKIEKLQAALFSKKNNWGSEKEIRLLSYNTSKNTPVDSIKLTYKSRVVSVYFGCKFNERNRKIFRKIFNGQDVSFYQMKNDYKNSGNLKMEQLYINK
jgi:hypothetical protein